MELTTLGAMAPETYDRRTIALHWITAALVVLAWGMAQIIDFFPRGWPRVDARSVHMLFGASLGVVLALRIAHRAGAGRVLPAADAGLLGGAAKSVHYVLYAVLIAQVLLGLAYASLRGDSVFGLFSLVGTTDKALRNSVGDLHALLANIILAVAGLHAAAALFHHFVWRDNVLRRMIPGLPAPDGAAKEATRAGE
jgi:cytochrome b561